MTDPPTTFAQMPPLAIGNPPAQGVLSYRVGTFTEFRRALLEALPAETETASWRAGRPGDLAVQMLEWWAYLADILTFYNERIANELFLGTATFPESTRRLIGLLGYRLRPGIGATAIVAAINNSPDSFTLPRGFQIQSKPGPGQQPQIFELDADTEIAPNSAVDAATSSSHYAVDAITAGSEGAVTVKSLLLKGVITSIKPGDQLLLAERAGTHMALVTVKDTSRSKDPRGLLNTLVNFDAQVAAGMPSNASAGSYRLLKSMQTVRTWPYPAGPSFVFTENGTPPNNVHLDSVARQIKVGDRAVFDPPLAIGAATASALTTVMGYGEAVWYANPAAPTSSQSSQPGGDAIVGSMGESLAPSTALVINPNIPPQNPPNIPLPILHSVITCDPTVTKPATTGQYSVRISWQDVGDVIGSPAAAGDAAALTKVTLTAPVSIKKSRMIIMEDSQGYGSVADAKSCEDDPLGLQLTHHDVPPPSRFDATRSMRALFNLMSVSRGQTVNQEILGSGDAGATWLEFVLAHAPLTYLTGAKPMSGYDYGSTLTVYVDGTAWAAVPSLYDASPTDRVYIAFEDDAQQTHVRFGDGVHGARLPTGVGNVTATYRYGSGADAPGIGTLTNIVKPYPKLQSVRNPIAAVGGADPQSPADGMRNATSSMRFLGRAVSIDDYATLAAAQTPTVVCARAFPVTGTERRYSAIAVYVGGLPTDVESAAAVSVAQSALKQYGAPDQRVAVLPASRKAMSVELNVVTDPNHDATTVPADVRSAVTDLLSGKTRPGVVGIGDVLFNGEIFAACLSVPGVKAVDGFHFYLKTKDPTENEKDTITEDPLPTHSPGQHGFYQLMDPENDLKVTVNGQ